MIVYCHGGREIGPDSHESPLSPGYLIRFHGDVKAVRKDRIDPDEYEYGFYVWIYHAFFSTFAPNRPPGFRIRITTIRPNVKASL